MNAILSQYTRSWTKISRESGSLSRPRLLYIGELFAIADLHQTDGRPDAAAALDQIPPCFGLLVLFSAGGRPRLVQRLPPQQLQSGIHGHRRVVAAEHA